jgi:hypothetical protein
LISKAGPVKRGMPLKTAPKQLKQDVSRQTSWRLTALPCYRPLAGSRVTRFT